MLRRNNFPIGRLAVVLFLVLNFRLPASAQVRATLTLPDRQGPSYSVVVADFNGDHHADLAVLNNNHFTVSISLGNGDGSFQFPRVYAGTHFENSIAVGDFNGDGFPDLVIAGDQDVAVLLSNGDGTFKSGGHYATGSLNKPAVAVGDFNHDGVLDVAVAGDNFFPLQGVVEVLLGNGDGSFQPAVTYSEQVSSPPSLPHAIVVGDFNGDGQLDLVTANSGVGGQVSNTLSVLLGNKDGTFQPAVTSNISSQVVQTNAMAAQDLNGDGRLDLVIVDSGFNAVAVLNGNGDGTFQAEVKYFDFLLPQQVAVGDFNGDGYPDLEVAAAAFGSGDSVLLYQNNGTGRFQSAGSVPSGVNTTGIAVGDFDEDHRLDTVVTNPGDLTIQVFLSGPGPVQKITVAPGSASITAGNGQAFTATAQYLDGSTQDVTNAALWKSSDTTIVTMSGNVATGVTAGGPVTITATFKAGIGTASLTVTAAGGNGNGSGNGGSNGGGGAGTGTCGCAKSGNYQDPALAPEPAPDPMTSPHGKYSVTGVTIDNTNQQTSFEVVENSTKKTFQFTNLPITTHWFFSPDDDRLAVSNLTPGTTDDNVYVYDLTAPATANPVAIASQQNVIQAGSRRQFSPAGRYFVYTFLPSPTTLDIVIFQVSGGHGQIFDSGPVGFATGSGDQFGEVTEPQGKAGGWGFSPDASESSFVFAYIDTASSFHWTLVNLAAKTMIGDTLSTIAAFWQFNPCGDIFAIITQPSQTQAQIDLFSTGSGAHLHNAASPIPGLNPTLFADTALQKVQFTDQNGIQQTAVMTSDPSCAPNTLAGNNVNVSSPGPIAGATDIAVDFANVTGSGVTTIAPLDTNSCPAVPGGFDVGNPPVCFDLSTSATYDASRVPAITVCINYGNTPFANADPSTLFFHHFENGAWTDRTIRPVDTANHKICAGVQSLSPFALFHRIPMPLTIKANDAARPYGSANPVFTASYSGFVNGEDPSVLSGQLACVSTASSSSPIGTYPIDCSSSTLTSPNYIISYLPGVLTVTPAPLTLAADNQNKTYGAPPPALTFTGVGFVNNDTAASLTTQPTLSAPVTAMTAVGTYPITIGGAVDANYNISYAPGTLVVNPASLTIAANNASRPYGANNPAFSGSVSGLQNGDVVTLTFMTSATAASPVGQYAIVPSPMAASSVLSNYVVTPFTGMLAVLPETTSLTLTIAPASITVGQSATITLTLSAPDMVIPFDPAALSAISIQSTLLSDILSGNGACTPVPSSNPGVAMCSSTLTVIEPNGRSLTANFAGTSNLLGSTAKANFMVTAPMESKVSCINSDFRNIPVAGGDYLWFNSILRLNDWHDWDRDDVTKKVTITFFQSSVQFQYRDATGNVVAVKQTAPDTKIVFDPSILVPSTTYDAVNQVWLTTLPFDTDDAAFLTGMAWLVPSAGIPGDIEPVTWCGTFASDTGSVEIGWRWATAAYSTFSNDNTVLGIKPMNSDRDNPAGNRDNAGTPENFKQYLIPGARGRGGRNFTGNYSGDAEIE